MKSTLEIDVSSITTTKYGVPTMLQPFVVAIGTDSLEVMLTNIPQNLTERMALYEKTLDEKQEEIYKLKDQVGNPSAEVRQLQAELARLNDAPRPPVSDEALREMLNTLPAAVETIPRIKIVRILTGWGLQQAKTFVEATPIMSIDAGY